MTQSDQAFIHTHLYLYITVELSDHKKAQWTRQILTLVILFLIKRHNQ